jgi:acyl carrier protein
VLCEEFALELDSLSAATTLDALGLDSLALTIARDALEQRLGLTLPDGLLFETRTLGDLSAAIERLEERSAA